MLCFFILVPLYLALQGGRSVRKPLQSQTVLYYRWRASHAKFTFWSIRFSFSVFLATKDNGTGNMRQSILSACFERTCAAMVIPKYGVGVCCYVHWTRQNAFVSQYRPYDPQGHYQALKTVLLLGTLPCVRR